MTQVWLQRTRSAAKFAGDLLGGIAYGIWKAIPRLWQRARPAARFAGGLLVLIIGIVGSFGFVLFWSEILKP